MSYKFRIKTQKQDGTISTSETKIAKNDADVDAQVQDFLSFFEQRGKVRKLVDIEVIGEVKTRSRLQEFIERTGITPQYGDYEATGWMDKKHYG